MPSVRTACASIEFASFKLTADKQAPHQAQRTGPGRSHEQQEDGGWGHYLRKNNNTQGTKWSSIETDLEPGVYRVIVAAASSSVRGDFAVNFACADNYCDRYAPPVGEFEEPGVGTPDQPRNGTVSFEMPLQTQDGTLLSAFNSSLRDAGLEEFPDYVTVSSSSRTPAAEFEHFASHADSEEVLAVTDSEISRYGDPALYLENGFCYRGVSSALALFTADFSDNIFSDQYVVGGWRAGSLSAYGDWHEPTESSGDLDEWNEFDANADEVMIIFSTDDNGTPEFASIPRCN